MACFDYLMADELDDCWEEAARKATGTHSSVGRRRQGRSHGPQGSFIEFNQSIDCEREMFHIFLILNCYWCVTGPNAVLESCAFG